MPRHTLPPPLLLLLGLAGASAFVVSVRDRSRGVALAQNQCCSITSAYRRPVAARPPVMSLATDAQKLFLFTAVPSLKLLLAIVFYLLRLFTPSDKQINVIYETAQAVLDKLIEPTGGNYTFDYRRLDYASYDNYDFDENYPDMNKGILELNDMPKRVDCEINELPIDYIFSVFKIIDVAFRALDVARAQRNLATRPVFEESYNGKQILKPKPQADKRWENDVSFAHQFLAGTNPVLIRRVANEEELIASDSLVAAIKQQVNDHLASNNLFVVSYEPLDSLCRTRKQKQSDESVMEYVLPAPVVLLAVVDGRLMPLGIQLDKETASIYGLAEVVLPNEGDAWHAAKELVMTADSSIHEWISHLHRTHLTVEGHIIAVNNQLKNVNHPVYQFLEPHLRDTLFLNVAARFTLLTYQGDCIADTDFSIGAGQVLEMAQNEWKAYDFFDCSFRGDLDSRGFGIGDPDLPHYYYKEDGERLWAALEKYTTGFVDAFYQDDNSVSSDGVLQKWAEETADPDMANIKGFPTKFTNKKQLASALLALVSIGTIQHNGVNFPQFDFMSFQPSRPSIHIPPKIAEFFDYQKRHSTLVNVSKSVGSITYVLTLPTKHSLLTLKPGKYVKRPENRRKLQTLYDDLRKDLAPITADIEKRNQMIEDNQSFPEDVPYEYLLPEKVACSIDI